MEGEDDDNAAKMGMCELAELSQEKWDENLTRALGKTGEYSYRSIWQFANKYRVQLQFTK